MAMKTNPNPSGVVGFPQQPPIKIVSRNVENDEEKRMSKKSEAKRELILWGFHPEYCDGQPIKLEKYSKQAQYRREREGWTCAAYFAGDIPSGLQVQANLAKVTA